MSEQSQPAGSGPAGPEEDNEPASVAPRRRRNFRGRQLGAALTSRSAGWIVAAALAGSLATYLFAPPRTTPAASVRVAYQSARPATVQRGPRVVGPGGNARVQVPAGNARVQVPAGAPGPNRAYVAAPRTIHGRVQVVMPGGNASGPAAGQIVAVPGGNWVGAPMPACAVAGPGGLPVSHRMSISIARPGALKRIVSVRGRPARISWVRVASPQRVVIVRPPGAKRIVVGPSGARRVYFVRPAAGGES